MTVARRETEEGALPVIRPATDDDIPAIVRIERASFSDPWPALSFLEMVGREEVVFLVAEREWAGEAGEAGEAGDKARVGAAREVVGYAIVYLAAMDGDLANIAVAGEVRGQGVGRHLLRAAREAARARGVRVLFLEVRESNAGARRMYDGEGFVEVGRRSRYYVRPVEDALILRLEPV